MEIHNHYEVAIEIVVVNIIPIIKAVVVHVLPSVENLVVLVCPTGALDECDASRRRNRGHCRCRTTSNLKIKITSLLKIWKLRFSYSFFSIIINTFVFSIIIVN